MDSIESLVRENIKRLEPYSSARSLHLTGTLLDANENAYDIFYNGTTPPLNRYPDGNNPLLREKLASIYGLAKENTSVGSGSDELIDLLIRIFCVPGHDSICVCVPTYSMYRVAAETNDVGVRSVPLTGYDLDVAAIVEACQPTVKILFLCNPNNPTGTVYSYNKLRALLDRLECIIVIDEAYMDFSGEPSLIDELEAHVNLVVLKTLSKAYALAGARLGFAFASVEITALLAKVKMPYNINALTTRIVLDALDESAKIGPVIDELVTRRKWFEAELKKFDFVLELLPSFANFVCVKCRNADYIFRRVLERNIVLRKLPAPYLSGFLRISIGTQNEMDDLLEVFNEIATVHQGHDQHEEHRNGQHNADQA